MEIPSTASATGRCKHWLTGSYNGERGSCPHCEISALRVALDRIANMKNRDGVEIEMHKEEMRAIARTALRSNVDVTWPRLRGSGGQEG